MNQSHDLPLELKLDVILGATRPDLLHLAQVSRAWREAVQYDDRFYIRVVAGLASSRANSSLRLKSFQSAVAHARRYHRTLGIRLELVQKPWVIRGTSNDRKFVTSFLTDLLETFSLAIDRIAVLDIYSVPEHWLLVTAALARFPAPILRDFTLNPQSDEPNTLPPDLFRGSAPQLLRVDLRGVCIGHRAIPAFAQVQHVRIWLEKYFQWLLPKPDIAAVFLSATSVYIDLSASYGTFNTTPQLNLDRCLQLDILDFDCQAVGVALEPQRRKKLKHVRLRDVGTENADVVSMFTGDCNGELLYRVLQVDDSYGRAEVCVAIHSLQTTRQRVLVLRSQSLRDLSTSRSFHAVTRLEVATRIVELHLSSKLFSVSLSCLAELPLIQVLCIYMRSHWEEWKDSGDTIVACPLLGEMHLRAVIDGDSDRPNLSFAVLTHIGVVLGQSMQPEGKWPSCILHDVNWTSEGDNVLPAGFSSLTFQHGVVAPDEFKHRYCSQEWPIA
ncbi:hypothetical protein BKA62DRAFT_67462 [Auriculariales sp. MPI-PUGE-AT-0066]|nr:hypothetical protein BKA62DRAFT_67462 [Auriculariales sp. MPI-PUGE-AT-0066]